MWYTCCAKDCATSFLIDSLSTFDSGHLLVVVRTSLTVSSRLSFGFGLCDELCIQVFRRAQRQASSCRCQDHNPHRHKPLLGFMGKLPHCARRSLEYEINDTNVQPAALGTTKKEYIRAEKQIQIEMWMIHHSEG